MKKDRDCKLLKFKKDSQYRGGEAGGGSSHVCGSGEGGGGGSSYITGLGSGSTTSGTCAGNGQITITY